MAIIKKQDDLNRSTSSVGSKTSAASVVLKEDLVAARPPRPKETQPKLTRSSRAVCILIIDSRVVVMNKMW